LDSIRASGGGILNQGDLTIANSTVSNNYVNGSGGGILSFGGTLTVLNSMFRQNTARAGGGLYNGGTAMLVRESTISDNSAIDGAGIWNNSSVKVVNSTISLNNATRDGGGFYNANGLAEFFNASIVFNGADADADVNGGSGGGFYDYGSAGAYIYLYNSLVAGNNAHNAPVYDECTGALYTVGRGLVGTAGETLFGCTVTALSGSWTQLNSLSSIGPLQNNGGPTFTHALLPVAGNNAIDGGDPTFGCKGPDSNPLATDQRGFPRVSGVRCDLGAFEYSPVRIDIDGNNQYDALTDGLLIIRYLFGLTGTSLTNGAIGTSATRTTPTDIVGYLDSIKPKLDVDGNGQSDALTDGLMLIRYLFGLRGASLTAGAIGTGATRTGAQIETYIQSLMP